MRERRADQKILGGHAIPRDDHSGREYRAAGGPHRTPTSVIGPAAGVWLGDCWVSGPWKGKGRTHLAQAHEATTVRKPTGKVQDRASSGPEPTKAQANGGLLETNRLSHAGRKESAQRE